MSSCSTQRATVDLPDPLSPTRPSVVPRSIEKLTFETACTMPLITRMPCSWRIGNSLTRSVTSRTGAVLDC